MKKHFFAIAVLLGSLLLESCQKEISFEGGGLPPSARRCVDCTYLPFCDSSEFTYLVNGTDTAGGLVYLANDTLVNGVTFAQVSPVAGFNNGLLYSCAAGDYRMAFPLAQLGLDPDSIRTLVAPLLDSLLPVPADPNSLYIPSTFYATVLKANSPQGATWLDTLAAITIPYTAGPLTINLRLYAGIEYTYLGKDISYNVLGTNYTNVQHVQGKPKLGLAPQLPIPAPLPAIDGQIDFYLATDIGLVEMKATDSTGTRASAQLIRYRR